MQTIQIPVADRFRVPQGGSIANLFVKGPDTAADEDSHGSVGMRERASLSVYTGCASLHLCLTADEVFELIRALSVAHGELVEAAKPAVTL